MRGGRAHRYMALLDKARHHAPDIFLRTTFIVGFPGESEADYQKRILKAIAEEIIDPETGKILPDGETGELVDFVSDDRLAASRDGKHFVQQRWSTPVGRYRSFGPVRVPSRGEGRWHPPEGEYACLEIELIDLQINPGVHGADR